MNGSLSLLILMGLLVFLLGVFLLQRARRLHQQQLRVNRMKRMVGISGFAFDQDEDEGRRDFWLTLSKILGPKSPKGLQNLVSRLNRAGFRQQYHLGQFLFIKLLSVALVLLVTTLYVLITNQSGLIIFLATLVAYFVPEKILDIKGDLRTTKINQSLPDFIDMANVCLNAGLSWMVAVQRVAKEFEKIHPEIAEEFALMQEQINLGMSRVEALRQLEARVPTDDVRQLVQVLIQNERSGSSIAQALHSFARRIYEQREQIMAEKAAKASAKMSIIILPFLMLPYFIILLGEKLVLLGRGF